MSLNLDCLSHSVMQRRMVHRFLLLAAVLNAGLGLCPGQENQEKPGETQGAGPERPHPPSVETPLKPRYTQELDWDAAALATIPPDPLYQTDPLRLVLKPIDNVAKRLTFSRRAAFAATYTFLNQYATITPDGVRHNQTSGRLDFSGTYVAYDHESTAGSFSLLIRSGTNIGYSQQWNLSDALGSGIYLNCLQGGGAQRPITVNILYYRQDFLARRLSFYVGKLHPNEYISLSMYNNDERSQFLNGENDGNLAIASDGTYAGGGAVEFQATRHLYFHAVAVDADGSQQSNLKTMADLHYLEALETGWFSGSPGKDYQNYRFVVWHDDTSNVGSGYGAGLAFEREFPNGWAPFSRLGFATETGTTIKQTNTLGVAQTHPWGRRGDMFGASFSYTEPTHTGKHHESIFESFYRVRLTQSMEIGPDVEVSIHPTYAAKAYTTTLLSARMRIIF
jgi:porin